MAIGMCKQISCSQHIQGHMQSLATALFPKNISSETLDAAKYSDSGASGAKKTLL